MKTSFVVHTLISFFVLPIVAVGQLIQSQTFQNGSTTFTETFTQAEPLNIIASGFEEISGSVGSPPNTIEILVDGQVVDTANGLSVQTKSTPQSVTFDMMTDINFTATPPLSTGQHTITVTVNNFSANGAATLIAPNEPSSGSAQAIETLTTEINQNTTDIAGLQTQLNAVEATLQGEINQANANIATLTGEITALQSGQTSLQNTQNNQAGQITTLQNGQTTQAAQITGLQGQLTNEQADIAALQAELAAIPPPNNTPPGSGGVSGGSQFTDLQNQINSLKGQDRNQWIGIAAVGLLGATGTALGAYDLSNSGGTSGTPGTSAAPASNKVSTSSNPYAPGSATTLPYSSKKS